MGDAGWDAWDCLGDRRRCRGIGEGIGRGLQRGSGGFCWRGRWRGNLLVLRGDWRAASERVSMVVIRGGSVRCGEANMAPEFANAHSGLGSCLISGTFCQTS